MNIGNYTKPTDLRQSLFSAPPGQSHVNLNLFEKSFDTVSHQVKGVIDHADLCTT